MMCVHVCVQETWEKRFVLLRAMVELIAQASHRQDSQHNDYTDCVSDLFQIAVDISIHGERVGLNIVLGMTEG